jgi:Fur family ferric uptake transcriptional regulator
MIVMYSWCMEELSAASIGLRRTRQRAAILDTLSGCRDLVSVGELHERLESAGTSVGLTTVYRALRELERAGRVDVIRDEVGKRFYRRRPAAGHCHYLVCRSCGFSRAVNADVVERWAARLADESGFAEVAHTVELVGLCPNCQRQVTGTTV